MMSPRPEPEAGEWFRARPESERREWFGDRRICMIGGARYGRPLGPGAARKFETLAPLGTFWVIGFTETLWPRRFTERGTTFYLLPGRLWPIARYFLLFLAGAVLCGWCVFVHGARILVAQSPYEAVPAALVKRVAHWLGRRVVLIVESHGDFGTSLFLQRTVRLAGTYRRAMRWAAAYGSRAADLLRAVSDATGRQLQAWAGPRPLVVFHTWTDLDLFFTAGENRRPGTAFLYAGALTPLKGVHVLIEAFAAARAGQDELFVLGRAVNPGYAAELRHQVQNAGLGAAVHFLGHVTQTDLARRLAAARAFVLPSFSEGLPRVVLEAMAAGVPVIATPVSGVPELVEEGVTGWLVPPGDVRLLADRMRWVLTHPADAEAVGAQGRAVALRRFSVAAYREGYAELFARAETLLGTDRPNPAAAIHSGHRGG